MRYFIAGHTGLVGSAICRKLDEVGEKYFGASSNQVDFKNYEATFNILKNTNADTVIIAAAKVGGIKANSEYPVEFLNDNMLIGMNIINASFELKVPNLVFLGSSCIYPKFAEQPISEDSLLTGQLEDTNRAYAISKISCVELIKAYRRQYGVNWFSVMPTNIYGINDNFDLNTSHVMPAIIRKIYEAKSEGKNSVEIWGTGSPKREFMNSDDLADAILFLLKSKNDYDLINIGVGYDISIKELVDKITSIVGFSGEIVWNTDMPDGTPRKLMNSQRLFDLGWRPSVELDRGIKELYDWYIKQ